MGMCSLPCYDFHLLQYAGMIPSYISKPAQDEMALPVVFVTVLMYGLLCLIVCHPMLDGTTMSS